VLRVMSASVKKLRGAGLALFVAGTQLIATSALQAQTVVEPTPPAEAAAPDQIVIKKEPLAEAPALPAATPPETPGDPKAAPDQKVIVQENATESDGDETPPAKTTIDPKTISSGPTLLLDAATGEVISETRAGENWYPASLTKLMTAYVVFKKIREGKMQLDQQLSVSMLAARQPASRIGVAAGATVTTELALKTLLVYSANDMAYVLAENASGSVAGFSNDMNAAARALGMTSSYFVNPNGLYDPRQIVTARDLGLLALAMFKEFPEYSSYYGLEYVDMGRRRVFNRNMLIRLMPEADGMKTGFVCDSGFNLIASAKRGDRRLVAVVLGTKSGYSRAVLAKSLLEQGFASPAAQPRRVADIAGEPYGVIKPMDMTSVVCRNKDIAEIVDPSILSGWGVSFGLKPTAQEADDTLHRYMLTSIGLAAPGYGGTYRPIDKSGFMPVLWGMDQASAVGTCDKFKLGGISCSVVPETLFELYAQMHLEKLKSAKAARKSNTVAQGSDGGGAKKKAKARVKSKLAANPTKKKTTKAQKKSAKR
jgi:D-alanyl-D-alanine carboxypeptidase